MWNFRNELFTLLVISHRGKAVLAGENGAVVLLLTKTASAPWRPTDPGEGGVRVHKNFGLFFGGGTFEVPVKF